jgi:hypothetical protein
LCAPDDERLQRVTPSSSASPARPSTSGTLHTDHDDMPHGFLMFSRLTSRADESMDEMAREAGKRLGRAEAVTERRLG